MSNAKDILRTYAERFKLAADAARGEARERMEYARMVDSAWERWDLDELAVLGLITRRDAEKITRALKELEG